MAPHAPHFSWGERREERLRDALQLRREERRREERVEERRREGRVEERRREERRREEWTAAMQTQGNKQFDVLERETDFKEGRSYLQGGDRTTSFFLGLRMCVM